MDHALSLREAAQRFGISLARLRKAAEEGRLQVHRVVGSRERVVLPSEVDRFLMARGHGAAPKIVPLQGSGTGLARVIAVAIPKGGTGKTTTTANLAAAFVEQGKRVLMVDFDPQANLTLAFGFKPQELEYTVYEAIETYIRDYTPQLDRAILRTAAGIDLVPARGRLNLSNTSLIMARDREQVLRKLLEPLRPLYDLIVIDTLPYLGILVENALVAAQEVLIPSQAAFLSSESVLLLVNQIRDIHRSGLNPDLRVCGILLTQVKEKRVLDRHFRDQIRQVFGQDTRVFQSEIKAMEYVERAQTLAQTVLQYSPTSEVAQAYRTLAQEVWHGAASE